MVAFFSNCCDSIISNPFAFGTLQHTLYICINGNKANIYPPRTRGLLRYYTPHHLQLAYPYPQTTTRNVPRKTKTKDFDAETGEDD